MPRVGLYLTDLEVKKLKAIAKKTGLTVSELIRRIIDEGLEKYETKGSKTLKGA